MRYCSVPKCYSHISKDISMHYFPSNVKMQNQWRQALCIEKPITKYMQVCSLHFTKDDFFYPGQLLIFLIMIGMHCS